MRIAIDGISNKTSGGAFQATNQIHNYISKILDPVEILSMPTLSRFERALDTLHRLRDKVLAEFYRQGIYKQSILDRKLYSQEVDFVLFVNPIGNVAQINHTPYVTTVWDLGYSDIGDLVEMRKTRYGGLAHKLMVKNLRTSSALIVESEELFRRIHHNFQIERQKIFIIKFVPHERFLSYPIKNTSSAGSEYLLYPANFWSHKNHRLLLQSMFIFREKNNLSPTKLVFTGIDAGNKDHIVREAKAMNLSDYISFTGFIEQDELFHLYLGAKAILFPTLLGPTNIPPLEALALGKFLSVSEESSHELEEFSGFEINSGYEPLQWVKYFDPEWVPPEVDVKKNREILVKRNHENEIVLRKLLDFVVFRSRL